MLYFIFNLKKKSRVSCINLPLRFRTRDSVYEKKHRIYGIPRNYTEFSGIKQRKIPHKIPNFTVFQKVTSGNTLSVHQLDSFFHTKSDREEVQTPVPWPATAFCTVLCCNTG
jgi:hypothetical protein